MVKMADSSRTLGSQEERDLKKFVKFLSLKAVQVIVQSRLGEKIHTKSKPKAMGQDWFNLAISDLPEVTSEVKKVTAGRLPCRDSPLCVEISLTTSEGESMVLETWCLGMNDRVDTNAKVTYTVYNRIGMLLKSLLSVTRATPAYRLSRKQGADFFMCYRVYFGEVRFQELGAGFQTLRVGSIGTPVGSITLSAAYRTKLTLPERQQVIVQSNHFASDVLRPSKVDQLDGVLPCVPGMQETFDLSAEARDHIAEQIASATETEVTRSSALSSNTPPSSSQRLNPATTSPPPLRRVSQEHSTTTEHNSRRPSNLTQPVNFTHVRTKGAFVGSPGRARGMATLPTLSSTPPFASLLRDRQESEAKNSLAAADSSLRKNSSLLHRKDSVSDKPDSKPLTIPAPTALNQLGWDDDFVMVELKPAFASHSGTTTGDLGSFYRECQTAPPLHIFQDTELLTVGNIMEHLDGELCCFRQNAFKFDELLADLQQT